MHTVNKHNIYCTIYYRHRLFFIFRILRYTYGVEVSPPFDPKVHDVAKRSKDGKRCLNVFKAFMERGQPLKKGSQLTITYHTTSANQRAILLKIYATDQDIKYTTDAGCRFVGTMEMKLATPRKELQDLEVTYAFGDTEIRVVGRELQTNHVCETVMTMNA